ncbi:MAG TPA: AsmA family protein [Candidatus Limnocylindrales bacterium]|nr:AsmA family protein [Candidatus Limnocylindrales bacterium]
MPEVVSIPTVSAGPRRRLVRRVAWIGLGVFGFLLAAILVTPHFVDLGLFKRTYLPLLEEALNRRIDVDEVHLSLVPTPAISLSKLTVSDSAAYADNIFFSAQQIRLKLRFLPLLRGRFEITELVLDKPIFNLLKQPDGSFNYSDIGSKKTPAIVRRETRKKTEIAKPAEVTAGHLAIPNRVRVQDGELNVITKGLVPVNIKGIELTLQEFIGADPFPFRLAFNYPGLKTISLEGQLNYQEEKALLGLKNNRLRVQDLTFPVEGYVSNLATTPRVSLSLNSESVEVKSVLPILAVFGLAPRDIEIAGPMALYMSVTGPSNSLVTQVRGLLKDVRVQSKRALKGNLSGTVDLRLPLGGGSITRRLQGNGKLAARDGELTNVNLIKKIQRVTGMIGLSKDERREVTTFQRLEAEFTVRDGLADFSRVFLVNPQLEVDGNGTLTLEQPTLSMDLRTTLSAQASAHAGRGRAAAFFKNSQGRLVVPLKVSGPLDNPAVNLNSEKLVESGIPKSAEKGIGSFFKGLFQGR